jgi:hypothetical protein
MNEENEANQNIEFTLNSVAVMADHFEPDTEFEISEEV